MNRSGSKFRGERKGLKDISQRRKKFISTGPHLDYRLSKDGRFRNSLREVFPAGYPVGKGEMGEFYKKRDEVVSWLMDDASNRVKLEEITRDALRRIISL